jgi:site-specific recombinase XerD
MSDLTAAETNVPALLQTDIEKAAILAKQEKAAATRKAYSSDIPIFQRWCTSRAVAALPAAVAGFLADQADQGIRLSTMSRRVAAIRYAHKLAGYEVPTDDERVRSVVRGHRRVARTAPTRKAPATAERIIAMALVPGAGVKAIRDRALLLLGFAGAFRRSELVALDIDDLHETDAGLRVNIRRSKTDQEAEGATIAILKGSLACPVVAVKNWLEAAKITSGPVFRRVRKGGAIGDRLTDQSVADIVKAQAERVGLDPTLFAGHSLRAGFLTSAAAKGASIFKMMDVSRHKSVDTLRGYVREAELFQDHAGTGLL